MALGNDDPGMTVKDFDDFKYPNRKPWLLVLVVAGVVAYLVLKPDRKEGGGEVVDAGEAAVVLSTPAGSGDLLVDKPVVAATATQVRAPGEAAPLLARAKALEARGAEDAAALNEARLAYEALLAMPLPPSLQAEVENRLGALNVRLVLSPMPMTEKVEYVVRSGDSIERIARRLGSTVEAVSMGNMVNNPNLIKAGDRFRVLKGEFTIVASKARRDLVLSLNGRFFKRYAVGTGKFDSTPVGTFLIADRIVQPTWWPQGGREVPYGHPENILGTRWMGFKATGETPPIKGYGIHGTWFPESIGKAESAGCIRMRNEEVEELFNLIPVGTKVTIEP